jgi:hypothetical protein
MDDVLAGRFHPDLDILRIRVAPNAGHHFVDQGEVEDGSAGRR